MPLSCLGDGLGQDVANVLVGLDAVVQGHAGDGLGDWCRPASLRQAWIKHLLLLQKELLLLLLEHSLLQYLLELQLDLRGKLALVVRNRLTIFVEVAFTVHLAVLRVLGVCRVLEEFYDLLGGEVVRDVADLPLEWLDVALASDHLLLLHLQE